MEKLHVHGGLSWKSLSWLTITNMRIAPRAEPTWVTMPHSSKAFLPFSLSSMAMLTLENDTRADTRMDARTWIGKKIHD